MNYTSAEQNLIVLSAIAEMTYNEKYAALSALMDSTPDFESCKNSLIKRCSSGVYNKVRETYSDPAFRTRVFEELDKRGIVCSTYFSDDYPELLRQIPTPPLVLFLKGRRELLKGDCFTIVGSRHSQMTALAQCRYFSSELSKYFTIVSGYATGGDSAALSGAECRAISVIASGFDHFKCGADSPVKRVESEGLLISEYFPTLPPQDYMFHVRNRILAGLSRGTLVVSAAEKSGTLITANYAADYGREVFAFPYSVGVVSGVGCNNLIKEGANLCQNPLDILSVFGLDLKPQPEVQLSADEKRVLEILKEQGEGFLPALSQKLGMPSFKLIPVLSLLEIKGLIVRLGGNRYGVV